MDWIVTIISLLVIFSLLAQIPWPIWVGTVLISIIIGMSKK